MYVRIARFEGGDRNWDDFAADVRETIRSGGQGTPFERASDAAKRMMLRPSRQAATFAPSWSLLPARASATRRSSPAGRALMIRGTRSDRFDHRARRRHRSALSVGTILSG